MELHVMRALTLGVATALAAACGSTSQPAPASGASAAAGPSPELEGLLSRLSVASTRSPGAAPIWDRSVAPADIDRAYPQRALIRGVKGTVTLECLIGFDGRLDCDVAEESPGGWSFGSAAMSLASEMRASPRMSDGNPSASETLRIEFVFDQ